MMVDPQESAAELVALINTALEDRQGPEAAARAYRAMVELSALAHADPHSQSGAAPEHHGAEQPSPAFSAYHRLLWRLHVHPERLHDPLRAWLASAGYDAEEATIPLPAVDPTLDQDGFIALICAEHEARSGLRHPMSAHLFEGDPPEFAELAIYLRHHWHRSRLFYRELADFSLGRDLAAASVIFRNLYDEGGGEQTPKAHPFLLQKLLLHLRIPCGFADEPELPQALAYLSNRIRCSRRANAAWGLAVLFSLEYGTPTTHGNIYRLLRHFEVPEEFCEFHHLHMSADVEHARELVDLIRERVLSAEDRATFIASLRHHRALGRRYFDAIWREIQATREP